MRITDRHGAAAEHFDYLEYGPEAEVDRDDATDEASRPDVQPSTATSEPERAEA